MQQHERVVLVSFGAWLTKDIDAFLSCFASGVHYRECYGPEYFGIDQLKRWFTEWNRRGTVLRWDILRFIHRDETCVAEWYFECSYDGVESGFDGVSLITFDGDGRMTQVKEFKSKAEHTRPYQPTDA